jgi:hypothetical protein
MPPARRLKAELKPADVAYEELVAKQAANGSINVLIIGGITYENMNSIKYASTFVYRMVFDETGNSVRYDPDRSDIYWKYT